MSTNYILIKCYLEISHCEPFVQFITESDTDTIVTWAMMKFCLLHSIFPDKQIEKATFIFLVFSVVNPTYEQLKFILTLWNVHKWGSTIFAMADPGFQGVAHHQGKIDIYFTSSD